MFVAERAGRETTILAGADSKSMRSKFLLIRGLFLSVLISIYKAAFFRVFARVCEAQLHVKVNS